MAFDFVKLDFINKGVLVEWNVLEINVGEGKSSGQFQDQQAKDCQVKGMGMGSQACINVKNNFKKYRLAKRGHPFYVTLKKTWEKH